MIHAIERAFAHHMPVIICPAPYFGVEFINQIGGRLALRCFDGFSDARQEAFDVFLGGLNEQFPIGVSAHVLSEKVEALRHLRNDCLRWRERIDAIAQLCWEKLNADPFSGYLFISGRGVARPSESCISSPFPLNSFDIGGIFRLRR